MPRFWKCYFGRPIHQDTTGITVYQNLFYRWFTFQDNLLQTLIHRSWPHRFGLLYEKHMTASILNNPGSCCILGLGGGGIVHTLASRMPGVMIDGVDCDPNVIHIAKQFFKLSSIKQLNIIKSDALEFIHATQQHYHHILIDLYQQHAFPKQCLSSDFFGQCKQRLMPDGSLVINLANPNDLEPCLNHLRTYFRKNTVCMPVKRTSNVVILAYNTLDIRPILLNLKKSRKFKKIHWDSQWGYMGWV